MLTEPMKFEWCPTARNVKMSDPWALQAPPPGKRPSLSEAWGALRSAEADMPGEVALWWADLQGGGALEGFRWAPPEERQAFRERLFALQDVHGGPAFEWGLQMWWEGGRLPAYRNQSWRPTRLTLPEAKAGGSKVPGWLNGRLFQYFQGAMGWYQPVFPTTGASYGAPLAAIMSSDPQEGRLQSWLQNFLPRLSVRLEPTPSHRPNLHGDGCDLSGLGMRVPWAALELAVNLAYELPADTSEQEGQRALARFARVHERHVLREWEGPLRGESPAALFQQWAAEAYPFEPGSLNRRWSEVSPRFLMQEPGSWPVLPGFNASIIRYLLSAEARAL